MTTAKKGTRSPLLVIIVVIIGLYLAYQILILLAKFFVYLGYNFFVFADNLFQVSSFNPVATWGIMGLFIGSIAGVAIAIKKYRLSKKLLFYPIGIVILIFVLLYFINEPANHHGTVNLPNTSNSDASLPSYTVTPSVTYYYATQSINARIGPSVRYPVAFVIDKAAEAELIERAFQDAKHNEWMKIKYNNQQGFVNAKFLRFSRKQ